MYDTTKDIRPVRDITNIFDLDRRAEKYELFADEVLPDNYTDPEDDPDLDDISIYEDEDEPEIENPDEDRDLIESDE